MTNTEKIDKIHEIARELGGEVREDYSGRGMFGATCYGIVCDDAAECMERAGSHGIFGAKCDCMGRQVIIYWPHIK